MFCLNVCLKAEHHYLTRTARHVCILNDCPSVLNLLSPHRHISCGWSDALMYDCVILFLG